MIALKVINMFERSKRDQLIREIQSLYNCECPAIIGFHGAFYREGAISIALEFMNGGSLANVIAQAQFLAHCVCIYASSHRLVRFQRKPWLTFRFRYFMV